MTEPVLVEIANAVATITLNRPDAMNSLDTTAKVALRDAVLTVATDDGVRCVVVTGTGRAFCVGQDLREHAAMLEDDSGDIATTVREHYAPICAALATMGKPVVAAVNGVAAGAGACIAFACDLRLVADTAGFNLAFASIGLSCDTGASWTLPRLVGHGRAVELLMMPRTVPAAEALALGLATRVVPAADLAAETAVLAAQLAAGPTLAYGALRRSVAYAESHSLEESLGYEADMMHLTGGTQDHRDAVRSFLTKSTPTFHGR